MALKIFSRKQGSHASSSGASSRAASATALGDYLAASPSEPHPDALSRLFQQNRYAIIIAQRERWADHPQYEKFSGRAEQQLEEELALVPAGSASLAVMLYEQPGAPEIDVEVPPFLMSIHPVTNARFQDFVDNGCYDDLELWPEEIWPHLIGLHDLTEKSGPRFWQNGRHDRRLADHPVVGISWYEANAYAKWVGLRLPTEAEWQMAASWRIKSRADVFRRYPWGDAMDYRRCNLWGSALGHIAPVDAFEEGCAPNGISQLIGNVWEWTAGDLEVTDQQGAAIVGEMPIKAVRGGAFDTYFDVQATSTFRTGQILLSRTHNCGFRCALDV